jgi:hypothetical protein
MFVDPFDDHVALEVIWFCAYYFICVQYPYLECVCLLFHFHYIQFESICIAHSMIEPRDLPITSVELTIQKKIG